MTTAPAPDGAWLNPTTTGPFLPDCVILDVDGVVVDVRASFREAVRATVRLVQERMGVAAPWTPSLHDITLLKRAGGFNDDIDVSIALAALGAGGRGADTAALCGELEAAGGGLRALRQVAPGLPRVDGRLTLRVFEELYWGAERWAAHHPGEAVAHVPAGDPGLRRHEVALAPHDFAEHLRGHGVRRLGLVTGRTPLELEAALDLVGWRAGDLCGVVTGDLVRKPDPSCLDLVLGACEAAAAVYVGDVRDDWELVRRHRAERPGAPAVRGVIVGEDDELTAMRGLGVDATLRSVRDLLWLLDAWRAAPQTSAG